MFQSGLRRAQVAQNSAKLRELQQLSTQATQLIEQQSISAYTAARGSHPNILLSKEAALAASKNFQSVQEKYSQGTSTIIDLLDAQEVLLNAELRAAIAVYSYLKDVLSLNCGMYFTYIIVS